MKNQELQFTIWKMFPSLPILLICSVVLACAQTNPKLDQTKSTNNVEASSPSPSRNGEVKKSQDGDQIAEPTTTSIHQVWTSTSSGSLEELTPEMISKLRGDVPFLAAYATRPRLVNGAAVSLRPVSAESYGIGTQMRVPESSHSLEIGASSQGSAQLVAPPRIETNSPLSKLGEFNEFKVETSSSSRSEHIHRKKTSLKKKPQEGSSSGKRRVLQEASRLVSRRRKAKTQKAQTKKGSRRRSRKQRANALLRSQAKTNRLRRRLNKGNVEHHMNIIRHGRYQEDSVKTQSQPSENNPIGESGKEENGVVGTKGGGKTQAKPFYGEKSFNKSADSEQVDKRDDLQPVEEDKGESESSEPALDEDSDDFKEEEPEISDTLKPKRVGDSDVDEVEGDTVMVEPKSDGVDDDPELPEDPNVLEPDTISDTKPEVRDEDQDVNGLGEDERTKRVHRERPDGHGSTAGGGGIGATTGGGSFADGSGRREKNSPGVEFASEERNQDETGGQNNSVGEPDKDDGDLGREDNQDGEDSTSRKSGDRSSSGSGSGSESRPGSDSSLGSDTESDSGSEDTIDSSGRDEESTSKSKHGERSDEANGNRGKGETAEEDLGVDYRDDQEPRSRSGHNATISRGKEHSKGHGRDEDCHQDNHHHGHHDDHHHHDTIKWLEEAIPGQPGVDYPTLSSVNASTNFNCRDQKYPGYYADVESRCQVFHICQADGRQDSFL